MAKLLQDVHQHESVTVFHITHNVSEANELGTIRFELSDGAVGELENG